MDAEKVLKKVGTLGVGFLGNWAIVWGFDFALYPFVMWKCGLVLGCVVMTLLSFIVCYATIVFYDWCKVDWIGIESLKDLREKDQKGIMGKFANWIFRKGDWVVCLFLSLKFDPFITTAYMRHGKNQYNGLSARDWKIFLLSLLIGNGYWSFAMFAGVSLVEWILIHFKTAF